MEIVNGFYGGGSTHYQLPDGVIYGSLRSALNHSERAVAAYNSIADNEREAIVALNSVFMQDGAYVYVPRGVRAEKPFVIDLQYLSQEQAQICFPRILIIVEEGAEAEVVISHKSSDEGVVMANVVREIVVGRGSRLEISEFSDFNDQSTLITSNYLSQGGDSRTKSLNVWLRGEATRVNSRIDLNESGCDASHNALYLGEGRQKYDINLNLNHLAPDCTSNQLIKGVVTGNAVGAFTGRVLVAQDAQRTAAFQQSRNLQLSDTAKIYTEPQLEIYADDVKCSHGATVGQMNEDAVYYMRQRGISEADARRLQLFGYVNDVLSDCGNEEVCGYIGMLAQRRITNL